jgi:hypothetical protein
MSSFNRNIDSTNLGDMDYEEYKNFHELNPLPPVKGNLEVVDIKNLTEVHPKDLKINQDYLLLNTETNEKTKAKFIRVEKLSFYDDVDDEDYTTEFHYIFKEKDSVFEILIARGNDITYDNEYVPYENMDPYNEHIKFGTGKSYNNFHNMYRVFLPNPKIRSKILSKKLPEDIAKLVSTYGGKTKKSKKSRKSKKTRKSKKIRKT